MGLKGDVRSIRNLRQRLNALPITVAAEVSAQAAPAITTRAGEAYDSGRTVYGKPRPHGVDGKQLSLERTGASRRAMAFIATGRDIRTARLPRYTKYLIGKYDVLPNGPLPAEWRTKLAAIASDVIDARVREGGGQKK